MGGHIITPHGIILDSSNFSGTLKFDGLILPKYDIMGPFAAMPFMECRHKVLSMRHAVTGSIKVAGKIYGDSRIYICKR